MRAYIGFSKRKRPREIVGEKNSQRPVERWTMFYSRDDVDKISTAKLSSPSSVYDDGRAYLSIPIY